MNKKNSSWDPARAFVYGCSRQGASHIANDTPCQDAWKVTKARGKHAHALILAAADGHGANVHDLSEVGSRLAVQASCEVLADFIKGFKAIRADQNQQSIFRADVPKMIVDRWREYVMEDAQDRMPKGPVVNGPAVYYRYGTTLLAAAITRDLSDVHRRW